MIKKHKIDEFRSNWVMNRLQLKKRPNADLVNGQRKSNEELLRNVDARLKDLSEVLASLFKIYRTNPDLYGDRFLAFVGNEVIRKWPWIDFPFTTEKANTHLGKVLTGITNAEINGSEAGVHYEHWTPISFFRDLFIHFEDLTADDFYNVMKKYYQVVWMTKEEAVPFGRKLKSTRPFDAYEQVGIRIVENELWEIRMKG